MPERQILDVWLIDIDEGSRLIPGRMDGEMKCSGSRRKAQLISQGTLSRASVIHLVARYCQDFQHKAGTSQPLDAGS